MATNEGLPGGGMVIAALREETPSAMRGAHEEIMKKHGDQFIFSRAYHHHQNLCRRFATTRLYEHLVEEAIAMNNLWVGAELANIHLCSYMSAVKSLIDASSVALNEIYSLGLPPRDQDFGKGKFMSVLRAVKPDVAKRYATLEPHFREFVTWRDSAIHRVAPLILVSGPGHPDEVTREQVSVQMVAQPDVDVSSLVALGAGADWVSPLHFPSKWRPHCIELITNTYEDLANL